MIYYKLVAVDGVRIDGRDVKRGRVIGVEAGSPADKTIRAQGYWLEVAGPEDEIPGVSVVTVGEPPRELRRDWSGSEILAFIPGALGDTLIALNALCWLRHRQCRVVAGVTDRFLCLASLYPQLELVPATKCNDAGFRGQFDAYLSFDCYLVKNSQELKSCDYLLEAFRVLGQSEVHEIAYPNVGAISHLFDEPHTGTRIFIHGEASNPLRRWGGWERLITELAAGGNEIFIGGVEGIINSRLRGVRNICDWPLAKQLAVLSKCDYFIGVDSGLMHFAGMARVKGLALYGPTDPRHVGKHYRTIQAVSKGVCGPCRKLQADMSCDHRCMTSIDFADIASYLPKNFLSERKREVAPVVERSKQPPIVDKPKVVYLTTRTSLGGGEIQTLRNAKYLSRWFDFRFVYYPNGSEPDQFLKTWFEEFPFREVNDAKTLKKELEACDVVMLHTCDHEPYQVLENIERKPVIIRFIRSGSKQDLALFQRHKHLFDATVCVDKSTADAVGGEWVPSSIPDKVVFGRGRGYNFLYDLPILGYAGRLDDNKAVEWIVQNLHELACNLVLCVREQDHEKLRAICAAPEKLVCLPLVDDLGAFYRSVDAVVLNSAYEGSPSLVIEAAAYGRPAVSTRVGTLPDLFPDAYVEFTRSDVGSLNRAIEIIAKSGREIGKRAKDCVKDRTPEKAAKSIRKVVRRAIGKRYKAKSVMLTRWSGAGDMIMVSAFVAKLREMFPDAELSLRCGESLYNMGALYFDKLVAKDQTPEVDLQFRPTYLGDWDDLRHGTERMGGCIDEIYLPIEQKVYSKHPSVGFWVWQKPTPEKSQIKEWPIEKWRALALRLQEKGITCYQLGATFEQRIEWLDDLRQDEIVDSFGSILAVDCVVTIEGVAGHAAHALGRKAVVLWGRSSSVHTVGYDTNVNIVAPDGPCRCFGSFDARTIPPNCKANCLEGITVDEVFDAVRRVLK